MKSKLTPKEPVEMMVTVTMSQREAKIIRAVLGPMTNRDDMKYYSQSVHNLGEDVESLEVSETMFYLFNSLGLEE